MSDQPGYRPSRDMWNPVQVEDAIREVSNEIAHGVTICGDLYGRFLTADRVFDFEFAKANLAASGTVGDRKYTAVVKTIREREDRDLAEAAYRLADRRAWALRDKLSGLQTTSASIRAQYLAAGRGEGA